MKQTLHTITWRDFIKIGVCDTMRHHETTR
jgi:hypothetical protein